jgi:hypothetical protein
MAADLELKVDTADLRKFANLMAAAGGKVEIAIARAVNHTGDKVRTAMIRSLTGQSGLPRKTIVKALKRRMAWPKRSMSYTITARGGNVHLKFFKAREAGSGVSAAPWGQRRMFPGMFIKGGRPGARVALAMGGQVMMRTGASRLPIASQRSGLFIPDEMVTGATEAAFDTVSRAELGDRIRHELLRVL